MLPNTHFPQSEDVEKTPALLNRLDELLSRSLTASKLKTYLTCPLDFYYKYVLEFGDKETVEEEIEQATFGTLIHQTLEELYMGHTKFHGEKEVLKGEHRPIREEDIVQMQSNFRKILRSKFKEHFRREENFMSGNNFLAYEIATDLIDRFLQNERQFIRNCAQPVFIEALEYQMEVEEEFEVQGRTIKVKFRGNADRIDRIGDQIRIIDYKSGKVNPEDVTLMKQGEDLLGRSIRNRKHVLQLIQYTWMYYRSKGRISSSGIYSFLDSESNFHEMSSDALDTKELIEGYPAEIQRILEELYDTSLPFSHKDQRFSYCAYCE
jgi:RecB family exonuclease